MMTVRNRITCFLTSIDEFYSNNDENKDFLKNSQAGMDQAPGPVPLVKIAPVAITEESQFEDQEMYDSFPPVKESVDEKSPVMKDFESYAHLKYRILILKKNSFGQFVKLSEGLLLKNRGNAQENDENTEQTNVESKTNEEEEPYSTPKNRSAGADQINFSILAKKEQTIFVNLKEEDHIYKIYKDKENTETIIRENTNPGKPKKNLGSFRDNSVTSKKTIAIDKNEIVFCDWVTKESRHIKKWRQRWLLLTGTHLITLESQDLKTKPTEIQFLKNIRSIKSIEDEANKKNCTFAIVVVIKENREFLGIGGLGGDKDKTYKFRANDQAKKEKWINMIQRELKKFGQECCLVDQTV